MSQEPTVQIIHCAEVNALPSRTSLSFEAGTDVAVYLLDDEREGSASVRSTVLRHAGALAPANASLLMDLTVTQVGRHRVLRVVRAGRVPVDLVRADARSRVQSGTEFRSGARFDVALPSRGSVQFSLSLAAATEQGLRASVGGGGTRASAAAAAQTSLLWLVPTIIETINDPMNRFKDGAIEALSKTGISPRTFAAILLVILTVIGSGAFGLTQYFNAEEAKAELEEVKAAQADAQAAQGDALASEAACMVDRRALAQRVNDQDLVRRASVEGAYARALARSFALEKGQARFSSPQVTSFDAEAYAADVRAVLAQLPDSPPGGRAAERCRTQTGPLGRDLPAFLLSTHPDDTLTCPVNYVANVDGANLRGSWGLSERVATELRASAQISADDAISAVQGFDPRDVDRMSAGMLAAGVRSIRAVLIATELDGRPAVAPSELNLWSLALFDAANRLPVSPPGSPPWTLGQCVAELIERNASLQTTASPGEPVLGPVSAVAAGEVIVPAAPSATCAWPTDAVARGARTALRAVAVAAASPVEGSSAVAVVAQE